MAATEQDLNVYDHCPRLGIEAFSCWTPRARVGDLLSHSLPTPSAWPV